MSDTDKNSKNIISGLMFPIPTDREEIYKIYKQQRSAFWIPRNIGKFSEDLDDLNKLPEREMYLLASILSFFKNGDFLVNKNIDTNFLPFFEGDNYITMFYNIQKAVEDIHQEVYHDNILVYTEGCPKFKSIFEEQDLKLQSLIGNIENIIDSNLNISEKIVYFIFIEGLLFISCFAVIFWFSNEKKLPKLELSNEYISRDEQTHTQFGCELYKLVPKLTDERIIEISDSIIKLSSDIILNTNHISFGELTNKNLDQYTKYTADLLLKKLGVKSHYNVSNPFYFMNAWGLSYKIHNFDRHNTNYQY